MIYQENVRAKQNDPPHEGGLCQTGFKNCLAQKKETDLPSVNYFVIVFAGLMGVFGLPNARHQTTFSCFGKTNAGLLVCNIL